MNAEDIKKLEKGINASLVDSISDIIDGVCTMLDENIQQNSADDKQKQTTQMTLQAKIRIDYDINNGFHIKTTIPAKRITQIVGESECEINLSGQDELPGMNGENAGQEESED